MAVGPEHLDDRVQDLPRVEGADRADEDDEDCADDEVLDLAELVALHLRHRARDEGEHDDYAMVGYLDIQPDKIDTFNQGVIGATLGSGKRHRARRNGGPSARGRGVSAVSSITS